MPLGTREVLIAIRAKDEASRIIRTVSETFKTSGKDIDDVNKKAIDAGKQSMKMGSTLLGVGAGITAVGMAGVSVYKDMVGAAADYQKQVAGTFTQITEFKTSMQEIGDVGKRVGAEIGVEFNQLQPALKTIFSSIDVSLAQSETLLTAFSKGAVAGVTDVETSARSAIEIMNAFGLGTEKITHIMDVQFKTTQLGIISYEQYANVIGRATSSAKKAGGTIEDLSGVIAFLTRHGLSAAMASTSAARAFDLMSNPKFEVNMKRLGLTTLDSAGNFKPLVQIIQELKTRFSGMKEGEFAAALKDLTLGAGGTIQAMRVLNAGILDNNNDLEKFTDAMSHADGAMETAYQKMDRTYSVQVQKLHNNMDILRIGIGSALLPVINKLVETGTGVVKWLSELNPHMIQVISIVGAVGAGLVTLTGIVIAGSGAIMLMSGAWQIVSVTMFGRATVGAIGMTTNAIKGFIVSLRAMSVVQWTGLIAAVAVIAEIGAMSLRSMHQYNDFRDQVQSKIKTSNLESLAEAFNKTRAEGERLQDSQWTWTNFLNVGHALATKKAADDAGKLREQYDQTSTVLSKVTTLTGLSADSVQKLADTYGVDLSQGVDGATMKLVNNIVGLQNADLATQHLNVINQALADTVDGTADSFDEFKKALDATFGVVTDVDEAHIRLAENTEKLKEAYAANKGAIDLSTEAGRNYLSALVDQAQAIVDTTLKEAAAGDISALSADQKQLMINKLIEMQKQYPNARQKIQEYIDKVSEIQTSAATVVTADTSKAQASIDDLNRRLKEMTDPNKWTVQVGTKPGSVNYVPNIDIDARAVGGAVDAMTPYLVGEKGPELFVPGKAGEIITAHDTTGLLNRANQALSAQASIPSGTSTATIPQGGGQSVVVTIGAGAIQINVDGSSGDVTAQVENAVLSALRKLSNTVKAN